MSAANSQDSNQSLQSSPCSSFYSEHSKTKLRETSGTSCNSQQKYFRTKRNSIQQKEFSNQKPNCRQGFLNYSSEDFTEQQSQISLEQINIIVNNYPYEEPLEACRSNGNYDRIKSKEIGGEKTLLDYPPRLSTNGCNGRLLPELPITSLHNSQSPKLSCQFTNSSVSSSTAHINSTVEDISQVEQQPLISKPDSRASWSSSGDQAGGEEDVEEEEEEEEVKPYSSSEGGGSIAMAVGIFVATVVGTPVFFAAGIKLGMFAGIAGGAMGYTTGKMFADHE